MKETDRSSKAVKTNKFKEDDTQILGTMLVLV